ncbi:hypothetical protein QAD02_005348 [Eretmocerus hayati]|uniref:Uncharacterized protein n=1 Tax=Eretmocerus hayati TaxID=131215 RepID=A0ACC2NT98_9HYME|nr:hypothetical protein QAD02_005348 [Eretmocerus hayati]
MPHKYIGRTTDFKGKTLWQLLGNLKNFGVGRTVARNRFMRYPEPSYNKVLQVEALPNDEVGYDIKRKVIVLVERVFRGLKYEFPIQMESATYKSDYVLIPKCELHKFTQCKEVWKKKSLPPTMDLPPLTALLLNQQMKMNSTDNEVQPKMKVMYNRTGIKTYQPAETPSEAEVPEFTLGLGTPATSRLYKNIKD